MFSRRFMKYHSSQSFSLRATEPKIEKNDSTVFNKDLCSSEDEKLMITHSGISTPKEGTIRINSSDVAISLI
jgi:hypothetical protein